jgi:hypothetical protein
MRIISVIAFATLATAAAVAPGIQFEKQAQALHGGKPAKSLKLLSRRAQGLAGIYSAPSERGADLYYVSSNDLGESWSEPQRINHIPGEVSDHGENSAQLFFSPDELTLYAFWNARDVKGGSHVRFSRGAAMMTAWSPAVTLDDDPLPNSHGFQGAGVGPDGTLYAAWLDMREREAAKTGDYTAGAAAVYVTRSTDGGKTWSKNVRVARDVCPCCRAAFGFTGGRVVVAWRGVDSGDMRDVYAATSADSGATWSKPAPVYRDNWKIKGCPHVGPSLATVGDKLFVVWFSEAGGKPGIFYSTTTNGERFSPRVPLSEGTVDPSHPFATAYENRLAVTFKARDPRERDSWGKSCVYYREIGPGGVVAPLIKAAAPAEGSVSNPAAALGMSGRTFLSWTENRGEAGPRAMLLRGRAR